MKVTVFGSGYVGLVTGTCLAEVGNHVICINIDSNKEALIFDGRNLFDSELMREAGFTYHAIGRSQP